MKNNDTLKKYITDKYGGAKKFLKKENFSPQDLETMLHKKDIFHEISIAVKVCGFLNIDAVKLFCENEIAILEKENADKYSDLSLDEVIKEKYAELNADGQKKALDYANYIFENGI